VGDLGRGLEGLRSGEAAGLDEVRLDGEGRVRGNGGRGRGRVEEAVEVGSSGGGREETGSDEALEAEHGGDDGVAAPAAWESGQIDMFFLSKKTG
jgi:hypothetical protein